MKSVTWSVGLLTITLVAAVATGQSSSLLVPGVSVAGPAPVQDETLPDGQPNYLSAPVAQVSLAAVRVAERHKFAVHDLVTIVINEDTEADTIAYLDAKKNNNMQAGVTQFPTLNWANFLQPKISGGTLTNPPQVATNYASEFKGDSSYQRKDTLTSRITAQIIDVKPNGTLVLEAHGYLRSEKETTKMVLSGICRKEDVAIDNTVLSTQIYDLHLEKDHRGEMHNSTTKGVFSKVLDTLFNF
jgi:flagellar L-ring protein precursor FlgH